jgi:hypothetical protein
MLQSAHGVFDYAWNRYGSGESAASLAACLAELDDPSGAVTFYREAVKLEFATSSVRNNLGYYLSKNWQLRGEAIAELEESIRQEPKLPSTHENQLSTQWNLVNDKFDQLKAARALGETETATEREIEARDNLQVALAQIDAARDLAPSNARLERAAARLYALAYDAASTDTSGETSFVQREMLERVLSSCRAAVAFGLPPDDLRELSLIAPRLEDDLRFAELLKSDPRPVAAVPTRSWVDIYPDIRTRLLSAAR